ncbi:DUF1177 family protein [Stygiolobus caldivivus]|uniref:DUF1177 domain-containing protein n=1 Tax=Stygiolobus caldivivus TaxID=2824673 RepID=A0A8D5ZKP7_9CREN|nr:DUF1177 family protein [Stygiolobus caldivivus]BCU71595.1 hypothetical protein KN1_28920 [Stygiolobus caldivivus]
MILESLIKTVSALETKNPKQKILEIIKNRGVEVEEINLKANNEDVTYLRFYVKNSKNRTVEVLGRLGAVQINNSIGLVSDADGAIVSLTVLLELLNLIENGFNIPINVTVITNVSTNAMLIPHQPFYFMVPLVGLEEAIKYEVDKKADTLISIDSTKGNKIAKYNDFAITHVIKEGYILRVTEEIIDIYTRVTNHEPYFIPLTTGDLTPLSFKVYHISTTLVSPWIYTDAAVLGVATVSAYPVPGYATGVMDINMLEHASRFILELIKYLNDKNLVYYDDELKELKEKIGNSNLLRFHSGGIS